MGGLVRILRTRRSCERLQMGIQVRRIVVTIHTNKDHPPEVFLSDLDPVRLTWMRQRSSSNSTGRSRDGRAALRRGRPGPIRRLNELNGTYDHFPPSGMTRAITSNEGGVFCDGDGKDLKSDA